MKNYTQLSHEFIRWKDKVNNVNRYYTNTRLLDLLRNNRDLIEYRIPRGEPFFRGRIFNIDDVAPTNSKYENWIDDRNNIFEGYGKKDSGAPPRRNAAEGRLNGKGISFLYTCNSRTTVIYELRPTRDEKVSIAEFVTERDVVFADLTRFKSNRIEDQRLSDLLMLIADEFSTPHYAGHNYSFTQYLAGQFMDMGFDGIIFRSSLDPNGDNYVFFYPQDCVAINSRLFIVDSISIDYSPISRIDFQYFD
jgi:hypothetical protein